MVGTPYPLACCFFRLEHHLHSPPLEKRLIKRTMQYMKDGTKSFDDYVSCKSKNCKLRHVKNKLNLIADYHNKKLKYADEQLFYLIDNLSGSILIKEIVSYYQH